MYVDRRDHTLQHDPSRFPGFASPFFARYTLFDACAPFMAAFSPPLTPSKSVVKTISSGVGPEEHERTMGLDGIVREGACSPCDFKDHWTGHMRKSAGGQSLILFCCNLRGAIRSRRVALARVGLHFRMTHMTGSAVRPPVEYSTPSAKRARILSEAQSLSERGVCLRGFEH